MPKARIFTAEEHAKIRRLRLEQKLSWEIIAPRLHVHKQRLIEEARAIGVCTDPLPRKKREALPTDPPPSFHHRPPMRANSEESLNILRDALRLEDRWKDDGR